MRHFILYFGLAFVLMACTHAREHRIIQERKIYKQVMGQELLVDVFYTDSALERKGNPAIAFFHGGGWAYGNPAEFHNACRRYAEKGFVTFSFSYRLSVNQDGTVPHPVITPVESVKDARSALRQVENVAR